MITKMVRPAAARMIRIAAIVVAAIKQLFMARCRDLNNMMIRLR